jgi:hypothetical protein
MAGWQPDATLTAQSEARRDFGHTWQAADEIVYVAASAHAFGFTLRAPNPRRVNSIFLHCSRQPDRQQLRLPVVPCPLGANPRESLPLIR